MGLILVEPVNPVHYYALLELEQGTVSWLDETGDPPEHLIFDY